LNFINLIPSLLHYQLSVVYTHGAEPRGKIMRPSSSKGSSIGQPSEKLTHLEEPSGDGYADARRPLNLGSRVSSLKEPSSNTGGDLIHKVIKAVQTTQVPEPPAYYKNHHEGLRHYEQVARSRISLVRNDLPGTLLSEQHIRPVITDKHAHLEATRWATTQRWDIRTLGPKRNLGTRPNDLTLCNIVPQL
jgi:hypothetical protein